MFASNAFPLEPALWYATAVKAPSTGALEESLSTDVAIIGAGYAGTSAALHLAESGVKPVVLEAKQVGFGGSGRSGGQLVPGLKYEPSDLRAKFPGEVGEKLVQFAGNTATTVLNLISRLRLNVPCVHEGWIQPAHNSKGMHLAEKRTREWQDEGADVSLLSRDQVSQMMGTKSYLGGWIDKRGAALQPLSYVRELARTAIEAGASIYTDTPVVAIAREDGRWLLRTSGGATVKADTVIVCANAYSLGLWPSLKETIVDANTYQVATEVLPKHVADSIFPEGHTASDTRNLLFYFRKDHTGRFIMGGRGPFREPRGKADWAHLQRAAIKMYPQLSQINWEFYWCGRVAVTRDFLPHLHEPAPGLLIDIGCMGRGIGLQTSMGAALAQYVQTRRPTALPIPLTSISRLPMHALRRVYVSAVVTWYRLNDGGA